jgi:hypothetical protein
MDMKQWWNDYSSGNRSLSEKNLHYCHFAINITWIHPGLNQTWCYEKSVFYRLSYRMAWGRPGEAFPRSRFDAGSSQYIECSPLRPNVHCRYHDLILWLFNDDVSIALWRVELNVNVTRNVKLTSLQKGLFPIQCWLFLWLLSCSGVEVSVVSHAFLRQFPKRSGSFANAVTVVNLR